MGNYHYHTLQGIFSGNQNLYQELLLLLHKWSAWLSNRSYCNLASTTHPLGVNSTPGRSIPVSGSLCLRASPCTDMTAFCAPSWRDKLLYHIFLFSHLLTSDQLHTQVCINCMYTDNMQIIICTLFTICKCGNMNYVEHFDFPTMYGDFNAIMWSQV